MRKKMENLVKKLDNKVMYFTENPLNYNERYEGCKYFLVWQNTHQIYNAYKTQQEVICALESLIEQKIIWIDSHGFKVTKEA